MSSRALPVCSPPVVAADNQPPAPVPTVVLQLPSWIFPSVNSLAYDNTGDIALPAIGVESTVLTFTVPRGHNGVIKEIANAFIGGGFTDGSGGIVWRGLQKNSAIRGQKQNIASPGAGAAP